MDAQGRRYFCILCGGKVKCRQGGTPRAENLSEADSDYEVSGKMCQYPKVRFAMTHLAGLSGNEDEEKLWI